MPTVLLEIKNNIAFLTLNRPQKYNAFNREMALLLQQLLKECNENDEVRCLLLTGAGTAFSAGQDLEEVTAADGPDTSTILKEHYNPVILQIRALTRPVVAAVNGVAAGAGANIALCCDVVIASAKASFIQAFSKIGLIPDSGGTYFLPRLTGWQKAMAFAMLGDKVPAEEAERLGMIYKVIEENNFMAEAEKLAATLAAMPTQALALIKQAFNQSLTNTLEQQLSLEEELQIRAGTTDDYKEGVRAFLEKRKPVFKGK